jgi:hypothetical protein
LTKSFFFFLPQKKEKKEQKENENTGTSLDEVLSSQVLTAGDLLRGFVSLSQSMLTPVLFLQV